MNAKKSGPDHHPAKGHERIRLRILVPLTAAIVLLLTVFGLGLHEEQLHANERSIVRAAQSVQRLLNDDQRRCTETMSLTIQELLNDDTLAGAIRDRNRAVMRERTDPLFESLSQVEKITHFCLYSGEKNILWQNHDAGRKQDASNDRLLLAAEQAGQTVSALEQSPMGSFGLRTVSPWLREGRALGYVELGVDLRDILLSIHQELQVDLFVAVDKAGLQQAQYEEAAQRAGGHGPWEQFPAVVVTDKTLETIPETAQNFLRRATGAPEKRDTVVNQNGKVTQIMFLPLNNSEGRTVGQLIILRDISQAMAETDQWKVAIALICLGLSAGLTLFFNTYLGRIEKTLADGTVKLREANEQLEKRVQQRTNQLQTANVDLQNEIARREQAQQELVAAQRQLLASSRQAGMAEVATSVLHNVGNVLNSMGVSVTLVNSQLRRSEIANLRRATAILREKNGALAEYLTTEPKGKLLLEYLGAAADQLAVEHAQMIAEMDAVGRNFEHIKEIVTMQQSYAKVSGAFEILPLADLVEDALEMNSAAFDRHQVRVVREMAEDVPEVCVDRHKVLQILINLLSNAKYALDAQNPPMKQLVIRVETAVPGHVKIIVRDNGIGIDPGHLVKIFNAGFTTKKQGHGFGLHSGANAAREIGGSLTAQSEGAGLGATFILELPAAVRKKPGSTGQEKS